jgi:hypothetical protein
MGGVGKTSIAARYYNKGDTSKYTAWFYIDGSNKAMFDAGFVGIAEEANIYDPRLSDSELHHRIFKWLNHPRNKHWLILLDNVDTPGAQESNQFDFLNFIVKLRQGSIIVTTGQEWLYDCAGCMSLSIEPLNLDHSFDLLCKRAKDDHGHITKGKLGI